MTLIRRARRIFFALFAAVVVLIPGAYAPATSTGPKPPG
jgi:hypothetical protein